VNLRSGCSDANDRLPIYVYGPGEPWLLLDKGLPGVLVKYLRINRADNETVSLLSIPFRTRLPTHRHTGAVSVYTLQGRWHYPEHDWIAEAGSFVHEAAGSRHTPKVLDCEGGVAITLNFVQGDLQILNQEGKVVGVENSATAIQRQADKALYREGPTVMPNFGSVAIRPY
jgi:2,4'-dihydroxyacetophenone dioxygenase